MHRLTRIRSPNSFCYFSSSRRWSFRADEVCWLHCGLVQAPQLSGALLLQCCGSKICYRSFTFSLLRFFRPHNSQNLETVLVWIARCCGISVCAFQWGCGIWRKRPVSFIHSCFRFCGRRNENETIFDSSACCSFNRHRQCQWTVKPYCKFRKSALDDSLHLVQSYDETRVVSNRLGLKASGIASYYRFWSINADCSLRTFGYRPVTSLRTCLNL